MPRDPDLRRLLLSAAFFAVCLGVVMVLGMWGSGIEHFRR